uniref:CSN8/PSMD8/EIF3K domain-containing protein n=1 Tax=Chromera velia CCMP2878 TaxID=1169474 RepID=A0A0G4H746_9ALVE|eukprot:Cvel_24908.t1-p1 / transcript=Cvel_24908.t1 / gene=Cvel_24908 / organism=Chromera_velia_CCMP2878 / gene_product=COP9 signalosome complex subunit 8, putative / transcript_product=COP9 signalosome complex subunit 8, putative / location=Cvel_scaffold2755:7942-15610(+) / protein_length=358 / sequence_SO=supercontig / SO=protein_coding / is_pseudo=false
MDEMELQTAVSEIRNLAESDQMVPEVLAEQCLFIELVLLEKGLSLEAFADFYAMHMLSYLLCDNLCEAKMLWMRMPERLRQRPLLSGVHKVLQALWRSERQNAFETLERIANAPPQDNVDAPIRKLSKLVADKQRQKAFELLSRAFSSISQEELAKLTGLPRDVAVESARGLGWTEEANGYLRPVLPAPVPPSVGVLEQLNSLTQDVAFLEQVDLQAMVKKEEESRVGGATGKGAGGGEERAHKPRTGVQGDAGGKGGGAGPMAGSAGGAHGKGPLDAVAFSVAATTRLLARLIPTLQVAVSSIDRIRAFADAVTTAFVSGFGAAWEEVIANPGVLRCAGLCEKQGRKKASHKGERHS